MMRFFRKKESWKRFLIKLMLLLVVMVAVGAFASKRYQIGYDFQNISSIPGKRLYVIDKWDNELDLGNRYAFKSQGLEPIFDDGSIMVKILEAGPGDLVEVNDSYQVIINNAPTVYRGLDQATRIGQEKDSFVGKGELGEDEFWFMGTHSLSFDSRYYGAVSLNQVIGRAYPIL
jgi:conjugal transfer pilin signal peptidase TrbI|tara:strand:- start:47879 stop:48400 length:522 start_codon:yes stop_codon:yes gene_type:complete